MDRGPKRKLGCESGREARRMTHLPTALDILPLRAKTKPGASLYSRRRDRRLEPSDVSKSR